MGRRQKYTSRWQWGGNLFTCLEDNRRDDEVPCGCVILKVRLVEKEQSLTSVTCELFFNGRQPENKKSANVPFRSVRVPRSEKVGHVKSRCEGHAYLPHTHPRFCFSLSFVFPSCDPKNNSLCPRTEGCWVLFPNISIINQSFSKIQRSLQNFPLNQLPPRILKVLGAAFPPVSCRFQSTSPS